MPSISLPWATFFYNVSSVALVSGAVAVLAGTIGNVWMGSVKERYGDDRIAANEKETALAQESAGKANGRAGEANLEAGKANKAAAEANERAAALEKDAEQARLQVERIRSDNLKFQ